MSIDERQQQLMLLQQQMRQCRRCSAAGYGVEPPAVFSGRANARAMIIGQAPGVTEVSAGRPFNATAGKRLFAWLAEAGFDEADFRARHYMTSVTKCFPGKARNGGGDRVPSRAEQALCRSFLAAEIDLVAPALIIPVGRLAIALFFDKSLPLTQIIGTQTERNGAAIIPLPHPSGASTWHRSASNLRLIRGALRSIAARRKELNL